MGTNNSCTAWIDNDAPSGESNAAVDDAAAAVADLAANAWDSATARVVRQYYKTILPKRARRDGTDGPSGLSQTIVASVEDHLLLKAPILSEHSSSANVVSYHALQEWEGYVMSIAPDTFNADLVDMTRAAKQPAEHVELPLEEISIEQRGELRVGAVFRWTIGYETLPSGQRRRVSQLVFRQLPKWTQADIDVATELGSDRHRKIKWE